MKIFTNQNLGNYFSLYIDKALFLVIKSHWHKTYFSNFIFVLILASLFFIPDPLTQEKE